MISDLHNNSGVVTKDQNFQQARSVTVVIQLRFNPRSPNALECFPRQSSEYTEHDGSGGSQTYKVRLFNRGSNRSFVLNQTIHKISSTGM